MQFPVEFRLHRSLFLRRALLSVALVALAAVLLTPWPWSGRALALVGTTLLVAQAWRQLARPLPVLRCNRSGELEMRGAEEQAWRPVRLQAGSLIHPWLSVLMLREGALPSAAETGEASRKPVFRLVLLADSLPGGEFRRLRYILSWLCRASPDAQGSVGDSRQTEISAGP